jgi:ketosteroid isomerase-like protein
MTTTIAFDIDRLTEALQSRDAATQVEMYAPDATITVADRSATPSSPTVVRGTDEIRAFIEDICARDMTHEVTMRVRDERGAAYVLSCAYPDGTRVLCATVLEIAGGLIVRQTGVQAWDE